MLAIDTAQIVPTTLFEADKPPEERESGFDMVAETIVASVI